MRHSFTREKTKYLLPSPSVVFLWLGYLLLALVLTWPTVTHLGTHLPGDGGDDPAIAWNLWWVKQALLVEGQNPFLTDYLFYPLSINLAFYTLTVLNAVTALPLMLNLGLVAASNLHMLFTFVVGGYGTFLLVRYVLTVTLDPLPKPSPGRIWISAAIAGGMYAFASSKLFYVALGQFNIASTHWVPFAVLYLLRTRRKPGRLKNGFMAGLFLTMQAWAEMTYASFLLIFTGLYWLYWLLVSARRPRRRGLVPHLRAAAVMGLTFALGISPILAQMWPDLKAEGDFMVEGSGFAGAFSADLLGFFIPTMHHPWLGNFIRHTNIGALGSATGFDKGQHIYLGLVLLALLLITLRTGLRQPAIRFWLIAAGVFALLSLGPVISFNGHPTGLPGPFGLLQYLPFFKANRYPSRYSVMLLLSLSVVAGFGLMIVWQWLDRKLTGPGAKLLTPLLVALIPLLFLLEHLSIPLPQSDMRVPAAYQQIAAAPGDFSLLDIPVAWRNGFRITGPLTTQFMFGQFYQTTHHRPLLQGNTSRNPEFKFQYFTQAPLINSLLALETGKSLPQERWAADRAIAAEVLDFFNIRYIVVRPDGSGNPLVTPQAALPYIETVMPVEKIHDEPAIKIYRVAKPAGGEPAPRRINYDDSPLAVLYFGEGWGFLNPARPIAAQRKEVRLLLPLTGEAQRLTLRMRLPAALPDIAQSVTVAVDDWQSSPQLITPAWQELSFDLPPGAAQPGLNDVYLNFADLLRLPESPILDVTVLSAGEEVGDYGHIFVNGTERSPNQRGYNVVIIDPDGPWRAANFDTHLDPAASAALANFLATASPGALIAVAASDEASNTLGEEAVAALQEIGATGDLRGCFRCSHAFVRDQTGVTVEDFDPLQPAGVTTELGLTEPNIAALVDWIQIEPIAP